MVKEMSALSYPEWKLQLCLEMKQHGGKLPLGSSQGLFKRLAQVFGVAAGTIQTSYYAIQKKGVPSDLDHVVKARNLVDSANKADTESGIEITPKLARHNPERYVLPDSSPKQLYPSPESFRPPYPVGTLVEVRVCRIDTTFVMVETTDGYGTMGIIHRSQIRNSFASDVNRWFRFGDVLKAQITKFDDVKQRLELTTKNLPMKEYGVTNLTAAPQVPTNGPTNIDKLQAFKEQLETKAPEPPKAPPAPPTTKGAPPLTDELLQVKRYLQTLVGAITPEAEESLLELVKDKGMFQFTISLATVSKDFKPDLGLALLSEVKKNIGGYL